MLVIRCKFLVVVIHNGSTNFSTSLVRHSSTLEFVEVYLSYFTPFPCKEIFSPCFSKKIKYWFKVLQPCFIWVDLLVDLALYDKTFALIFFQLLFVPKMSIECS